MPSLEASGTSSSWNSSIGSQLCTGHSPSLEARTLICMASLTIGYRSTRCCSPHGCSKIAHRSALGTLWLLESSPRRYSDDCSIGCLCCTGGRSGDSRRRSSLSSTEPLSSSDIALSSLAPRRQCAKDHRCTMWTPKTKKTSEGSRTDQGRKSFQS